MGVTLPYVILESDSSVATVTFTASNCFLQGTVSAATGTTSATKLVGLQRTCILNVKGATGACSLKAIGIPNDYQGINIFASFTDTIDTDSAYFAMKTGWIFSVKFQTVPNV